MTTTPPLRPCSVCDAPAPREHGFDDVVLHRCPRCDHCFTDVESLDFQGEYDETWEALHENWFANPNLFLFALIAETIAQYKPDASVVDIGAGRGELLAYLREHNPLLSLTGIDVSLRPEIEGVEFVHADVNSFEFGDRRWDVAVSLATIEHLDNVQTFAARLRSLLVPVGSRSSRRTTSEASRTTSPGSSRGLGTTCPSKGCTTGTTSITSTRGRSGP